LRSFSNLDRSRFVRRDRSSPVKKNAQIFLAVVGMVISSVQSTTDHAATPNFNSAQQHIKMGVTKSDFSQMRRSRSGFD